MTSNEDALVTDDEITFRRHSLRDIEPPRPLTDWERDVARRILSVPFDGQAAALRQLETVLVEAECISCPLVLLKEEDLPEDRLISVGGQPVTGAAPGTLEGRDLDGVFIGLMIFIRDGRLSLLETFGPDNDRSRLPNPATLELRAEGSEP